MKLILNKHRNALLELIKSAQLGPQLFHPTGEVTEEGESFRLELLNSPHYFLVKARIRNESREFWYEHTTFRLAYPDPKIGKVDSKYWTGFEKAGMWTLSVQGAFKDWLTLVKKYLDYLAEEEEDRQIPDLWSELGAPTSSSPGVLMLQNTSFSTKEQARISESLHELLEEIKRRDILTAEQVNLLEGQIDYLVESSKRLGRKDWMAAAVGALIGVTLSAGLTTANAVQVIHLAGEALRWIAQTPLLLPQYRGL